MRKPVVAERTERRISAAASIAMCAVVILVQIASTLLLSRFLHDYAGFIYGALQVVGFLVAVWIYTRRESSPSYKLSWMCLLLALPVAGMLLFVLWGGTHQAKTLSLKKVPGPADRESARRRSAASISRLRKLDASWGRLSTYLQKRNFLVYENTDAKYFGDGADFFDDLLAHMEQAETYIFLEYYILAEARIWDWMHSVLQ